MSTVQVSKGYFEDSVYYNDYLDCNEAMKAIATEIEALEKQINAKMELLKSEAIAIAGMPDRFKVQSVEFVGGYKRVKIKAEAQGITVEKHKVEQDAYEKIGNHPALIQILNCGALSKEEKRKVLGLPATPNTEEAKGER